MTCTWRKTCSRISSLVFIVSLGILGLVDHAQGQTVLDYTGIVIPGDHIPLLGTPGGGVRRDIPPYPLPIELSVQSAVQGSDAEFELVVEVLMRNKGAAPFYLPADRNADQTAKLPGNRGRRSFLIVIEMIATGEESEIRRVGLATDGSLTTP